MEPISARQIVELIAAATGDSNEQGNPCLNIQITDSTEAILAISRLKTIKKDLRVLKRRSTHIQSRIRAESSKDFRNLFIADLIERNIGRRLEEGNVADKKQTLISLYKQVSLMIDDLIIQIDEQILRIEDYVIRNS
jgi:hypothetical protein